jgi:hypothetical protein
MDRSRAKDRSRVRSRVRHLSKSRDPNREIVMAWSIIHALTGSILLGSRSGWSEEGMKQEKNSEEC